MNDPRAKRATTPCHKVIQLLQTNFWTEIRFARLVTKIPLTTVILGFASPPSEHRNDPRVFVFFRTRIIRP